MLDPDDRLLMIRVQNDGVIVVPGHPAPAFFWILPGGGLEPGETFSQAARRELFEETGLTDVDWGPCLWIRDVDAYWSGRPVHAQERFFLARIHNDQSISRRHMEPAEHDSIIEHRWWPLGELIAAQATQTFFPPGLPKLLGDVLNGSGRLPSEPTDWGRSWSGSPQVAEGLPRPLASSCGDQSGRRARTTSQPFGAFMERRRSGS
ncbi:hypothetical protein GCM10010176_029700 [Nonomuraea spiralis]|nr:hypothetical protein GCM10010176_029700 [Nonomuraea spiralis]